MIRRLLICTKANDAIDALDGIWRRLRRRDDDDIDDDATVIILSNGALAISDAVYDRYGRGENGARRLGRTAGTYNTAAAAAAAGGGGGLDNDPTSRRRRRRRLMQRAGDTPSSSLPDRPRRPPRNRALFLAHNSYYLPCHPKR